ncbi:MAG TPA: P-loop NTPase fold protein [Allosphingosinicella sp.]|jgi:hypothetical protein
MVMIYEREVAGPATHALVIGVSGYPPVPDLPPHSASRSAAMFATWMRLGYRNAFAPLASLDWVFFDTFQIERAQQLTARGLQFVPPLTFEVVKAAIEAWHRRLRRQPMATGIFYFAGHAVEFRGDTALLLKDFQAPDHGSAIGLGSLIDTMSGLDANLLFIADAGRQEYSGALTLWPPQPDLVEAEARTAVIYAAPPDEAAHFDENGTSLFATALMASLEALSEGPPRRAGIEGLLDEINRRLPVAAERRGVRQFAAAEIGADFPILETWAEGGETKTDWEAVALGPAMPPPIAVGNDMGTGVEAPPQFAPRPADAGDGPALAGGEMPILDGETIEGAPLPAPRVVSRESEANTDFVPDDAETERDELGRSVLAIGLARRLHRIWRSSNEATGPAARDDERAAFVVHLDAPWGGGKTTFANFIARVLNPLSGGRAADFLRDRYGEADLGGLFLRDPPVDEAAARELAELPPQSRRPWIVVPFNAWQAEHCAPPWWVFYESIRKQCFRAIRREGDLAWRPRAPSPANSWSSRLARLGDRLMAGARGLDRWPVLVAREYAWRARNPKILSLFATAAFGGLMLLLLYRLGAWGAVETRGATTAGFVLTSGLGLFAAGLTGVSGLWALAALFTESVVPGTNNPAERLSLGTGDPFERFRRHFHRTMADLRRPVMVVIDDLDRCTPDFVVGLVRGIQTLLRSPRVVFVILGDRDWIERAFEAHHKAMATVDVGPEQTFGARFVEKAIQMSFILPAMSDESRLAYVRRVLLGSAPGPAREGAARIDAGTAEAVREVVNRETDAPGSDPFDTQRIVSRALEEVGSRPAASVADNAALQLHVEQLVGETLAINAAGSERVEQAVAHQLEALAAHFPANPRQIKRIVNAITIYYAVALQRPGLDPDEAFRTQLALWVIVMTEWPETWRLLASFPSLVPILQSGDPLAAVEAEGADLPGSREATARVVRRTLADSDLMALIRGRGSAPLDPALVPLLAQLTPLHSRRRKLEEGEVAASGDGERAGP